MTQQQKYNYLYEMKKKTNFSHWGDHIFINAGRRAASISSTKYIYVKMSPMARTREHSSWYIVCNDIRYIQRAALKKKFMK